MAAGYFFVGTTLAPQRIRHRRALQPLLLEVSRFKERAVPDQRQRKFFSHGGTKDAWASLPFHSSQDVCVQAQCIFWGI
jgi:hypothetical protein